MAWKRNSIFYRTMILSLLLIVVTVVIVMLMSFYRLSSIYRIEIEAENDRVLTQAAGHLETAFLSLPGAFRQGVLSHTLDDAFFYLFENDYTPANGVKISGAYHYLREQVAQNSEILHAVEVYYSSNQILLSSRSGVSFPDEKGTLPYGRWVSETFFDYNRFHIHNTKKYAGVTPLDGLVAFRFSYSTQYIEVTPLGFVSMELYTRPLEELLEGYAEKSLIVLTGTGDDILFSAGDLPIDPQVLLAGPAGVLRHGGQDYMLSIQKLGLADMRLLRLVPLDILYEPWYRLSRTGIVYSIIFTCISCVILIFVSFRIYNPLRLILERLRRSADGEAHPEREDLLIDRSIRTLTARLSDMERTLERNQPLIRSNFAYSLISGLFDSPEQINRQLRVLGIPADSGHGAVAIISVTPEGADRLEPDAGSYVKYRAAEWLEANSDMLVTILPNEDKTVCIGDSADMEATIPDLRRHFLHQYGIELTVSISGGVSCWAALEHSYAQAGVAFRFAYLYPERKLLPAGEYTPRQEHWPKARAYLNHFRKELLAEHVSVLGFIANELFEGLRGSQCPMEQVCSCVDTILESTEAYLGRGQANPPERLGRMRDCADYRVFIRLLLQTIHAEYEDREQKRLHNAAQIIANVRDYIDGHLAQDLSVKALSARMHFSPSYLGKLFIRETGISLNQYVNQRRMETARAMLETEPGSVSKVAAAVGYMSVSYFVKVFRHHYGVTPSAIRHKEKD